jgi:RTX calcium-binding nonapeptide repeat (4 copies)
VTALRRRVVLLLVAASVGSAPTAAAATASVQPDPNDPELGVVTYVAGPGETNDVRMREVFQPFGLRIFDSGATMVAGSGCTSVAPDTVRCDFDFEVEVDLDDSNDELVFKNDFLAFEGEAHISGGEGDDLITAGGGPFSVVHIFGGPGNDLLGGRSGIDIIDGGAGGDTVSGGTSVSCSTHFCSPDQDVLSYADRTDPVFVDTDTEGGADDGEALEGDDVWPTFERIVGGSGNDVFSARAWRQSAGAIFSAGTTLDGRAGNDVLRGTRFLDTLYGRTGDDTLRGRAGPDYLRGHQGEDRMYAGAGRDELVGGDDDDFLFARDGRPDSLDGGDGFDVAKTEPVDRLRLVEAIFL